MEFNRAKLLSVVKREIEMREEVYPRLISRNKMSKTEAEYQILAMTAIKNIIEKNMDENDIIEVGVECPKTNHL